MAQQVGVPVPGQFPLPVDLPRQPAKRTLAPEEAMSKRPARPASVPPGRAMSVIRQTKDALLEERGAGGQPPAPLSTEAPGPSNINIVIPFQNEEPNYPEPSPPPLSRIQPTGEVDVEVVEEVLNISSRESSVIYSPGFDDSLLDRD